MRRTKKTEKLEKNKIREKDNKAHENERMTKEKRKDEADGK
jgi:hypothetical protein